jgi:hypothetical protein
MLATGFVRSAAALAACTLLAGAAHAATVTIGTLSGTGTVVVANNAQNTPLSWSFDTAFGFDTAARADLNGASLAQVFGDVGQYRFQAASAGVAAVDGNGVGGPAQSQGTQQWQILNATPGNNNSTFFGNPFVFSFIADALNSPTGSIDGDLTTDGFVHWYYGYDNQAGGKTALLNPMFDFSGRYTITGFNVNPLNGERTMTVNLSGTISQQIPEPATLALVGAALLGGAAASRRRKQAA